MEDLIAVLEKPYRIPSVIDLCNLGCSWRARHRNVVKFSMGQQKTLLEGEIVIVGNASHNPVVIDGKDIGLGNRGIVEPIDYGRIRVINGSELIAIEQVAVNAAVSTIIATDYFSAGIDTGGETGNSVGKING